MGDPIKKLGETLQDAFSGAKSKMPLRRHRDDDYWDELQILTPRIALNVHVRPRYKTSGLSGDEWRIAAVLVAHDPKSNIFIYERVFHRIRDVLTYGPHFIYAHLHNYLHEPDAEFTFKRKTHTLWSGNFNTFGEAAIGMAWHVVAANEGSDSYKHLTDQQEVEHCQQVGCSARPVNFYQLKMLQEGNGSHMTKPEYDFVGQFVWYCGRHTERGDCGLEDCDKNMILVAGDGTVNRDEDDESPSVFGGSVHIK
jgi:hypothetical protein